MPKLAQRPKRILAYLCALLLLLYLLGALVAAHRLTRTVRGEVRGTPLSEVGLAYEEVAFPSRGDAVSISGWFIPAAGERAVIFTHGHGSCRTCELGGGGLAIARALHDQGLDVLMIDLRGHGLSGPARHTLGVHERWDVEGAVDWLLGRGFAPGAVGLLGVSVGGASSLAAAAEMTEVGAVVADSSFADSGALLDHAFPRFTGLPAALRPAALPLAGLLAGADLTAARPLDAVVTIAPRPLLIIHAADDGLIPLGDAEQLAAAAPGVELWVIPARGHGSTYRHDPQAYVERVGAFFDRALTPGSR